MSSDAKRWWKEGVCYQVWPASFNDSNDDGHGDLQGLISKLDYLKDLGVDFIWLSPCYASPKHDQGYDISNYEEIDPDFGTLQDMDHLIKGVHDRGMKLLLDLVVNHTSTEHKWFQESMKSRNNEYSDYYIWRDPKVVDGKKVEPNNWGSVFGGSAWKYVEARDQYYLHIFLETQADVNWEESKVRQAMYKTAIRFWLDRGIDGFRVDACNIYSKPQDFPDAEIKDPSNKYQALPPMIADGPRMHEFMTEQRREALNPYGDIVMIGELGFAGEEQLMKYLDPINRELDMVFDMSVVAPNGFMWSGDGKEKEDFSLRVVRKGFALPQRVISELDRWATVFIENHDQPRSVSKYGSSNPELYFASGRCLALLLSTLSGTLFLYQGQEIGMANLPLNWPLSDLRDNWWGNRFNEIIGKYGPDSEQLQNAREDFQNHGRDHSRTPMQWTNEEPAAGFSKVKPWIKPNPTYKEGITVEEEQKDPQSLYHFWKKALALRKSNLETFVYGKTKFLDTENDKILYMAKYSEKSEKPNTVVVLNFTDEVQSLEWPSEIDIKSLGEVLLGTFDSIEKEKLAPREGRVYKLL